MGFFFFSDAICVNGSLLRIVMVGEVHSGVTILHPRSRNVATASVRFTYHSRDCRILNVLRPCDQYVLVLTYRGKLECYESGCLHRLL